MLFNPPSPEGLGKLKKPPPSPSFNALLFERHDHGTQALPLLPPPPSAAIKDAMGSSLPPLFLGRPWSRFS